MAGDRRARYLTSAWQGGQLEKLRPFQPYDRNWWRRLGQLVDLDAEQRRLRYLELGYAQRLAGAVAGDPDFAKRQWQLGQEQLQAIFQLLFGKSAQATAPAAAQLQAEWEGVFGRLDYAATSQRVLATAAAMERQMSETLAGR